MSDRLTHRPTPSERVAAWQDDGAPWVRMEIQCQLLGRITPKLAYALIATRGLPPGRVIGGKIVLYERAAILTWIATQPIANQDGIGKRLGAQSYAQRAKLPTSAVAGRQMRGAARPST